MRTRLALAMPVALLFGAAGAASGAADAVDGTITVTPIVAVSLELAPTFYAFGAVDVGQSTHSLEMQGLHNIGTVGVSMRKKIQAEPADWKAGASAGVDTYVLYATTTTASEPPPHAAFTASTKFLDGNQENGLGDSGGDDSILPLLGSTTIWYRLDMPAGVSRQGAQTITVRYTGTAQ
ncbi:MAG: hypothetical protein PHF00_09540 [Elusimicrobia bacterium]|nr:hypothetical protein [Elusimicrobiota bacterium]